MHVPRAAPAVARTRWRATCSAGWCRGAGRSNVFLRNGARLYLDVGSHPEYATPECDNARSTWSCTTRPASGSSRACWSTPSGGCTRRASPATSTCSRTTPTRPATPTAATRTTSSRRHGEFSRLADVLIPFLVTRQLICGAGKVLQTPRGAVYCCQPAGRAHLGGRLVGDHPVPADHQHPRRAARRRRALPPAARHRRRLEHERDDHAAQGRRDRPGAADDRGRRRDARPDPGEPDPGHPRGQPRHHRPAPGPAGQRPGGDRAGDPARVLREGRGLRRPARRRPDRPSGCSSCGAARWTRSRPATCR